MILNEQKNVLEMSKERFVFAKSCVIKGKNDSRRERNRSKYFSVDLFPFLYLFDKDAINESYE